MQRFDVLNAIAARIGARSYLEIGVRNGETFGRVRVDHRVGVDPGPGTAATVPTTSEQYWRETDELFDIVFVDGDHSREAALADAVAALRRIRPGGAVVLHDCSPPLAVYEAPLMCGGVWRAWVELRASHPLGASAFVVDTDLGCGVLGGPWPEVEAPRPPVEAADAPWDDLDRNRAAWLNLVTSDAFLERIRG